MTPGAEENDAIIKYLLGDLSDDEQAVIEQRFFNDEEYHDRLRSAETDLIDSYTRGELSGSGRAMFERRYLISPERQQRARFARALTTMVEEAGATPVVDEVNSPAAGRTRSGVFDWLTGRAPAWRVAWASAMAALLFAVIWLWIDGRRIRNQVDIMTASRNEVEQLRDQLAEQSSATDALSANLENERRQRALESQRAEKLQGQVSRLEQEKAAASRSFSVLSFLLSPGISRTVGEPEKLDIPPAIRMFRLQLELLARSDYSRFQVEVRTAGGTLVWKQPHSDRQARRLGAVAVTLPANRFAAGEYELTLKGVSASGQVEDIGYYYFKVARR